MRIQLTRMVIENFKGIQSQVIDFDPQRTVIGGRNETGKTTVADAFFYVLFGKDSEFRSNFDIIPLDGKNNRIHNLETSVELLFMADDEEHKIKRVLTELWIKKRGTGEEKELKGTTTDLFINDSPVKVNEFNSFISGIISEDKFKLLTSPTYFNVQMGWQERRKILTSLIENHSYEEIVGKPEYKAIKYDIIKSGVEKTEEKFRFQQKETKKNVSDIPARIDEASKNINRDAPAGVDDLKTRRTEISNRIDELLVKANAEYIETGNAIRLQIDDLGKEISEMDTSTFTADSTMKEKNNLQLRQKTITAEIVTLNQELKTINDKIDYKEAERTKLKVMYLALLDEVYNPESTVCPTCKQELPQQMKEAAENRWKETRNKNLETYQREAGSLKAAIENLKIEIGNKQTTLDIRNKELVELKSKLEAYLEELPSSPVPSVNYALLSKKEKKLELEVKLMHINPNPYKEDIAVLNNEAEQISSQLSGYEASEKAKERVAELEKQLKVSNSLLLEIEQKLDLIGKLKLEYVETVEGDLNKLFDRKIKVRLFEEQVNGGFRETCDILVQNRQGASVPWQFVNTAGQINSALQIINLLSQHLDTYCPVFIDHSESVEELFKIDSQMIELKFLASYPKLTVK
jgi:DNA repair exonuclease SbcCD ATPase subunit